MTAIVLVCLTCTGFVQADCDTKNAHGPQENDRADQSETSVRGPGGGVDSYLKAVKDFAETMLQYGTDRYGTEHTPQFATALTRGPIPELVPASPKLPDWPPRFTQIPNVFMGSDYAHKTTIRGGDVSTDVALYEMLYKLSALTHNQSYAQAADASLKWFIENTPDPRSGLFAWGEHCGWDFRKEQYVDGNDIWTDPVYWAKHEFNDSPEPLFEKFSTPSSGNAPLENFAKGIWEQHVWFDTNQDWFPGDTGLRYSRHGKIGGSGGQGGQAAGGMYPRHGGCMVNTMSAAYSYSNSAAHKRDMLNYMDQFVTQWELLHGHFGYVPYDVGSTSNGQNDKLASELRYAASRLAQGRAALATRMLSLAGALAGSTRKAYERVGVLMTCDIGNRSLGKNAGHTDKPDYNIGWDLPGKVPGQYAEAIRVLVDAAKEGHPSAPHTRQEYLARANRFGKQAMDIFLNDGTGSPLPRMLDKNSAVILVNGVTEADAIYHSYTGGDDLMLALLDLYEANQPASSGYAQPAFIGAEGFGSDTVGGNGRFDTCKASFGLR